MPLIIFLPHSGFKKKKLICFFVIFFHDIRKLKNLDFTVFDSKDSFFLFPDALRGNAKKQVTFIFLKSTMGKKKY